jgi:hypothetical protein
MAEVQKARSEGGWGFPSRAPARRTPPPVGQLVGLAVDLELGDGAAVVDAIGSSRFFPWRWSAAEGRRAAVTFCFMGMVPLWHRIMSFLAPVHFSTGATVAPHPLLVASRSGATVAPDPVIASMR